MIKLTKNETRLSAADGSGDCSNRTSTRDREVQIFQTERLSIANLLLRSVLRCLAFVRLLGYGLVRWVRRLPLKAGVGDNKSFGEVGVRNELVIERLCKEHFRNPSESVSAVRDGAESAGHKHQRCAKKVEQ